MLVDQVPEHGAGEVCVKREAPRPSRSAHWGCSGDVHHYLGAVEASRLWNLNLYNVYNVTMILSQFKFTFIHFRYQA